MILCKISNVIRLHFLNQVIFEILLSSIKSVQYPEKNDAYTIQRQNYTVLLTILPNIMNNL